MRVCVFGVCVCVCVGIVSAGGSVLVYVCVCVCVWGGKRDREKGWREIARVRSMCGVVWGWVGVDV